jgi:DNA-binding Lrp family transcriptional regulator
MDESDSKILRVVGDHGRWSVQRIAKATGIPITTVHYRLRKLEKDGVIRNYSVKVDTSKIGYLITAYVLVAVDYNILRLRGATQQNLAAKLLEMKWVESVSIVTGEFDVIIKVRVPRVEDLNNFIITELRGIEGVKRTETMLVLNDIGAKLLPPVIKD